MRNSGSGNEGTDILSVIEQISFSSGTYDLVGGTNGDDWLDDYPAISGTGDDYFLGGLGNDVLYGRDGNDILDGGDDNDYLDGRDGDDYLLGGSGNDYFYDHTGNDTMVGGLGNDVFFFLTPYSGEIDEIQDFDHLTDKIHIGSGFGVTDTNLFNYNSGTGALSFNGSQFATLTNSGFSIADDLILVYIMVRDVLSTR